MSAIVLDTEQNLLCRIVSLGAGDARGRVPLNDPIDWPRTLRLATVALFPLLSRRLDMVEGSVPAHVRARLEAARRGNIIAHLMRVHALRDALRELDQRGVPTVALKGIALAHMVYADPTLRPMQDIDIWVPSDRLDDAAQALQIAGFHTPRRHDGLWHPGERTPAVERILEIRKTPLLFELHGSLRSWAGLPAHVSETAWARSHETQIDGLNVRVLAPTDMLLHVGLHLSRKDLFRSGLAGLLDLRLVLEQWRDLWNWAALTDEYLRFGIDLWMRLAFHLARELVAAPVPDDVLRVLPEPAHWQEIEALALQQVWSAGSFMPSALASWLGAATRETRMAWVHDRLLAYTRAGPWEAGRRLWFDMTRKVPRYAKLWMRGELRGPRLREHLRLANARSRLEALVDDAERASVAREH